MNRIFILTTFLFSLPLFLFSQWVDNCPSTKVKLEIIEENGAEITFEIKLMQLATSTCGSYGLGNADFVINFDNAAFTSPTITAVPGFCDFVAKDPTANATIRTIYESLNTTPNILDDGTGSDVIIVNLNGTSPASQTAFDAGVAIIDQTEYTYGRFTISGWDGTTPNGFAWKTVPGGLTTKIYGIEDGDYDNDNIEFLSVAVDIGDDCVVLPQPDLTVILTVIPSTFSGVSNMGIACTVSELRNVDTDGSLILVRIPSDPRLSFTWNPTLTTIAFNPVNNVDWNYLGDNGVVHTFTTALVVPGGDVTAFGLQATYDPQNTQGQTTVTATVVPTSGGEGVFTNNNDAEGITYFD